MRGARSGPLQPVITRDEFKNTRSRNDAYAAIVAATEAPLQEAIESANRAQSEKSLGKLEETLTRVLSEVDDERRRKAVEVQSSGGTK